MTPWKKLIYFCGMLLLLFCGSCNSREKSDWKTWQTPNGKIKVLSTIAMIDDLVKEIGKEHVDTTVLIKGDLDPHAYQLVKGDGEKLEIADLIFYNGLGLEHGASLQRRLKEMEHSISLGDRLRKRYPDLILQREGIADPHIWMDISLWMKTIDDIVEALANRDLEHERDFRENGKKLSQSMQQAHQEIKSLLQQIPERRRFLVTSHDAFNYFGRAYLSEGNETKVKQWEKRVQAPEGLAPDSQLSSIDIQEIIDHLHRYGIEVLFTESNVSQDSIKKILDAGREKGLDLKIAPVSLYADAMGSPGTEGDTYFKMIKHNAKVISDQL